MAAAGIAAENRKLVLDEPSAALGEDRRTAGQARSLLLVAPGRESSDTAAVCQHGAAHLGATVACGVNRVCGRKTKSIDTEVLDGEVSAKSLGARENPGLRWLAKGVSETCSERNFMEPNKTVPNRRIVEYIGGVRNAKKEISVRRVPLAKNLYAGTFESISPNDGADRQALVLC